MAEPYLRCITITLLTLCYVVGCGRAERSQQNADHGQACGSNSERSTPFQGPAQVIDAELVYRSRSPMETNGCILLREQDRRVIVCDGRDLVAIDYKGTVSWRIRDFLGPSALVGLVDTGTSILSVRSTGWMQRINASTGTIDRHRDLWDSVPGVGIWSSGVFAAGSWWLTSSRPGLLIRVDLGDLSPTPVLNFHGFVSNPVVWKNNIVVASSGVITILGAGGTTSSIKIPDDDDSGYERWISIDRDALAVTDGTRVWFFDLANRRMLSRGALRTSSDAPAAFADGVLVATGHLNGRGTIIAVDSRDGRPLWSCTREDCCYDTNFVAASGSLFSFDSDHDSKGRWLSVRSLRTGEVLQRCVLNDILPPTSRDPIVPPLVSGDHLVAVTADGCVLACAVELTKRKAEHSPGSTLHTIQTAR